MTVTLKIDKTVYGGDGLGRLGDGRVCFVSGAYAGETVKAEIIEEKKHFVKARLVSLEEPLTERCTPGLTVPGMVYANVDYAAELRFKEDQLGNFLWKVEQSVLPLEVVGAPHPLNYRNKVTYHTQLRDGRWHIGYRAEPSHEVVDVEYDPLARPEINAALPGIRAAVLSLLTQGAARVRRSVAEENVTVRWTRVNGVKWWLGDPPANLELQEMTLGRKFAVPPDGFYQVNPEMADALVKAVQAAYVQGAEDAAHILDLYCGVGVFGLACLSVAPQLVPRAPGERAPVARLTGIESGRTAIAAAKRNAAAQGLAASFFAERVGASLSRIKVGPHHTVIVDPPRGGMEPNVPAWLANRPAPRLFYVSCDPATLVRDLQGLSRSYRIVKATLFDLFPRTARFETFVQLEHRK